MTPFSFNILFLTYKCTFNLYTEDYKYGEGKFIYYVTQQSIRADTDDDDEIFVQCVPLNKIQGLHPSKSDVYLLRNRLDLTLQIW